MPEKSKSLKKEIKCEAIYSMKIKYIQHEVMNDAPFIGALVVANDCNKNCINCFNQELRSLKSVNRSAVDIVDEALSNPLNEGIILGGLEWTEQINDMFYLSVFALMDGLNVMIYTSLSEYECTKLVEFRSLISIAKRQTGKLYIKFGSYQQELACQDNVQFGVKLATSNQLIKCYGGD